MAPTKAFKLDNVELKFKPYLKEKVAPEDGLYRYLYRPGELEGGTDGAPLTGFGRAAFRIDRIVENPGQRVLYFLDSGPKRAFVEEEELMLVPELPPDRVKNW